MLASPHLIHRLGFGWVARKRRERRSKYYSIERSAQKHLGNMCLMKNSLIETNLSIVSNNCTLRKVFFDKKLLTNDENDH